MNGFRSFCDRAYEIWTLIRFNLFGGPRMTWYGDAEARQRPDGAIEIRPVGNSVLITEAEAVRRTEERRRKFEIDQARRDQEQGEKDRARWKELEAKFEREKARWDSMVADDPSLGGIPSWYAAAQFEGDAMMDTPRVRDGWKAWYEAWQVEETARDHTHRKR